jgi:acylglycerol lipase
MIDMRGFGFSGGHRIQGSLFELFYDIDVLLRCCELNLPAFVMASGLGAMLLLNLLIENSHLPINGVIILSPTMTFPKAQSSIGDSIVKYLCRKFMGELLVNSQANPTGLTKRVDILKKNIDDGLNYQYIK